jgi:cell division septum initiation protein DivIVA
MGNEGLKIVIGADISAVTSELKVASSNVAQFGDTASKSFDEVAASAAALERLSEFIEKIGAEALGAGQQLEEAFQEPIKSIGQLEAEIESLEKELSSATDFAALKRLNDQIKVTQTQLNNLKVVGFESTLGKINPTATNAAKGIDKVTGSSKAAGAALTDINRVIQDSAFGFVGIQNNITELPGKFRALSAAAKESGQSVGKVLLSTLLGPAGIGTAISVITSALTFASVGFSAWTRGFTSSSDAAKKASATLDEYQKLLQSVGGEVGQSASRITTLVNALQSDSLNTSQRKKALEELKQQNQEFFGALSEEKGLINGLQAAYDGYLDRIKAIATAKAIESQLTKLFDKKLELELNIDPKFNAAVSKDTQKLIGDLTKQLNKLGGAPDISEGNDLSKINDNLRERLKLQTRIAKLRSANIVDLSGTRQEIEQIELQIKGLSELQKLTGNFSVTGAGGKGKKDEDFLKKQLDLLEKIRDAAKSFQGQLFDLKDIDAATDKLAALEQQVGDLKLQIALRDAKKAGLPAAEIERLKDAIKQDTQKRLNEAFEKEALLLEFSTKLKFSQVIRAEIPGNIDSQIAKATGLDKKIPVITLHEARIKILGSKLTAEIEGKEQILANLNKQVESIFEGGLNDAFSTIGESVGEALASGDIAGGLKKAAQNILGILGDVMQQLGKAVISAAIKIELLKKTLKAWAINNPALAIIAGIGLVAAGAALKNIKFDGPKFADGGIVSGPMIGQVGERFRPEVIIPLDRLPQLFKQFGSDGGGGTQLIPIINNEGLYLAMKRGERSAGRKF